MYGAECSMLNAHLEIVFGLRAVAPLTFKERGSGIKSLADVLTHYLISDYRVKPVIVKWREDLTEVVEALSESKPNQVSCSHIFC